jgi:hypothetical protein
VSAAERRALNENVFREMNERLERLGEEFGDDTVEFLCECADPACSAPSPSKPRSTRLFVTTHAGSSLSPDTSARRLSGWCGNTPAAW